jgi:mRNA interferase RelE/StbE
MASWELVIERRAQKALARIEKRDRDRIAKAIRELAREPRPPGAKKLTARDAYRVRVGEYRVLYDDLDLVWVVLLVAGAFIVVERGVAVDEISVYLSRFSGSCSSVIRPLIAAAKTSTRSCCSWRIRVSWQMVD